MLHHPNVSLTTDGGAAPYHHGEDTRSAGLITLDDRLIKQAQTLSLPEGDEFELLSEEELYAEFEKEETQHEKEQSSKA